MEDLGCAEISNADKDGILSSKNSFNEIKIIVTYV